MLDLFELGDMPACREEIARHARLADELRLPSFQWYTPLWAATEAALAGRFDGGGAAAAEAQEAGERAGDGNAELFSGDGRGAHAAAQRGEYERTDIAFLDGQDRQLARRPGLPVATSSGSSPASAATDEARAHLDEWMRHELAFDANWMSAQAEVAEAIVILGDPTHAQRRLRPARALRRPPGHVRPRGR